MKKKANLFLYSGTFLLVIKTVFSASKIIPYSDFMDTNFSSRRCILYDFKHYYAAI